MATLTVGRLSFGDPQRMRVRTDPNRDIHTFTGYLRGADLTATLALKTELKAQNGHTIAITYDTDPTLNGYYIQDQSNIDLGKGSMIVPGYIPFTIRATHIGGYSSTELQSLLSMVSAVEDFSTTPSYWWAPAVGARAVDAGGATPVLVTRDGADGENSIATDMVAGTNPSWSIDPTAYYTGAAYIYAADILRSGLEMPMGATDWYMGNGHMEIRPDAYQGTTTGEIEVRFHDGTSWGSWSQFFINWAGTNKVPSWDFVSILRNTAAACTIRLVRDAAESPFSTTAKHELDLTIRRGGRFVTGIYKFTGSATTHSLELDGSDTVTRPAGPASYVSADTLVSGNKVLYGIPRDFTLTTREITLDVASKSMPFWIGAAVDNAADATGNGPGDLAEQYVGQVAEQVRAVRR